MNERLLEALDEISDRHINEAATAKKRNTRLLIRAAAAIVAVVLLLGFLGPNRTATATQMLVSPARSGRQNGPPGRITRTTGP